MNKRGNLNIKYIIIFPRFTPHLSSLFISLCAPDNDGTTTTLCPCHPPGTARNSGQVSSLNLTAAAEYIKYNHQPPPFSADQRSRRNRQGDRKNYYICMWKDRGDNFLSVTLKDKNRRRFWPIDKYFVDEMKTIFQVRNSQALVKSRAFLPSKDKSRQLEYHYHPLIRCSSLIS